MEELVDLPVLSLRVTALAQDGIRLPELAGSSLRGAFGAALKRLVCTRPDLRQCAPCPLVDSCAYPYLFETAAPDAPGTVGFESAPRPYVIRVEPGERTVRPGEPLLCEMALIGRAILYFPYVALAWQEMGRTGIGLGKGRFELARVEALDLRGKPLETLYERESNLLSAPEAVIGPETIRAWVLRECGSMEGWECGSGEGHRIGEKGRGARGEGESGREVVVEFVTPTSLKHEGKMVSTPQFHIVWRSLQRRLSILRLAHGEGRPDVEFAGTIRLAERVDLASWSAREVAWERYSRRQERRIPMQGFVGVARYRGELTPFLPALALGSLVGIGDNCTFGQGHYRVMGR